MFSFILFSFDELIVGAPFYADKKKPNMGRVYVFGQKDDVSSQPSTIPS